ncbi:MAG: NTP transferase domain-containing protein [Eubacterium sp.]|nr:NTP transferase domain-containing protein [Eubacterium sp.]
MAIGILLAAGMGMRMRPLTETTAKPLLKVGDTMLIETVISALENYGVTDIYIVTGYKADQFATLTEKHQEVHLVHNPEYETKNNLSSLYVAVDTLRGEDCFICEADLYIKKQNILSYATAKHAEDDHSAHVTTKRDRISGYFAKYHAGPTDDWCFDTDKTGRITRVGKSGMDTHMMVGLSYFNKNDSTVLADAIIESYNTPGTENLFWDDVVNQNLDKLNLTIFPVGNDDLYEVDTPEELQALTVI